MPVLVQIESLGSDASIDPTAFDCDNGWVLGIGTGGGGKLNFERHLVSQLLSHLANQLVSQPVNRLEYEWVTFFS
jgi:hypothetical protein